MTGTNYPVSPTVSSVLHFIYTNGVPAMVDVIDAGIASTASTAMVFRAVHDAITVDGFVPANSNSVAKLAALLNGYPGLGTSQRAEAAEKIHPLLRQNEVDIRSAVASLKAARSATHEKLVLPLVERVAPARLMVHMPEGMLGARVIGSKYRSGRTIEYFPAEVEIIVAEIVKKFGVASPRLASVHDGHIMFEGLQDYVRVLIINDEGSTQTTLGNLAKLLMEGYARDNAPTLEKKLPYYITPEGRAQLPILRSRIMEIIRTEHQVAADRLESLAIASGVPLSLPEIREQQYKIDITFPDNFSIGKTSRDLIESFSSEALELILAALIVKFANGDASQFTTKFDPVTRKSPDDHRSRTKKRIRFFSSRGELATIKSMTPASLASMYARSRDIQPFNNYSLEWSLYLTQKVVAEILSELNA